MCSFAIEVGDCKTDTLLVNIPIIIFYVTIISLLILISLQIILILVFIMVLFKVPAMVDEFNSKIKEDGGKSLVTMEEKVKVAEVKLRVVEEELTIITMMIMITITMIILITITMMLLKVKLREVEEESRAKEADMHKVYDLVNRSNFSSISNNTKYKYAQLGHHSTVCMIDSPIFNNTFPDCRRRSKT